MVEIFTFLIIHRSYLQPIIRGEDGGLGLLEEGADRHENAENQTGKLLDHQILLEMLMQMSLKGQEIKTLQEKHVIEEFVCRLKPFYQGRYL